MTVAHRYDVAPALSAQKPGAARTRLILEGPIASTLLRLAAPNLVVNVVLIAVTTSVDAHFIGRFGPDALAGLALVFPLIMLMQQMANNSMGGALAAAIARAIGAGRGEDAAALIIHGLVIACGQTLWPLIGVASRALVVAIGGWMVIHAMDAGLVGLAVVTAAGLITAGAIIAIAFRLKTKPGPTS